MHIGTKLTLAASMTLMAVGPTSAAFWHCVPEIDGSAGISALAAVVAVAMVANQRLTH